MSNSSSNKDHRTDTLKNEQTRQRWDLFHRAIEHAKRSNTSALESTEDGALTGRPLPLETPTT